MAEAKLGGGGGQLLITPNIKLPGFNQVYRFNTGPNSLDIENIYESSSYRLSFRALIVRNESSSTVPYYRTLEQRHLKDYQTEAEDL